MNRKYISIISFLSLSFSLSHTHYLQISFIHQAHTWCMLPLCYHLSILQSTSSSSSCRFDLNRWSSSFCGGIKFIIHPFVHTYIIYCFWTTNNNNNNIPFTIHRTKKKKKKTDRKKIWFIKGTCHIRLFCDYHHNQKSVAKTAKFQNKKILSKSSQKTTATTIFLCDKLFFW